MQRLERQRALIALVERQGDLTLEEACRSFAISPATVRRDFTEIVARGAAEKTWGGLRKNTSGPAVSDDMVPSGLRETLNVALKERIARAASALVQDGDVLAIDGGTTTLCMAPHLANRPVRIITNSLLIAHRIDRLRTTREGAEVFLTGGLLYPGSGSLLGPQTVDNLGQYHTRWAFLSCGGLDAEGTTNTNQLVAEAERAMIRMTTQAIVLADSTKWSKRDMVRVCGWKEISLLVTDAPLPADLHTSVKVRITDA
ncbi:DeoR/GlpR family DNA-binding transcription regulator [Rariglobus hedericola]|nr:DeoR/GlpR family DNA-binding transcription regulator [Rariglobus hedericola]